MIEAAVVGVHGRLDGDDLAACVCRVCERLTHGDSSTLEATRCGPVHCPHSTEAGGPARNHRPDLCPAASVLLRTLRHLPAREIACTRVHRVDNAALDRGVNRATRHFFPRSISILDVNG